MMIFIKFVKLQTKAIHMATYLPITLYTIRVSLLTRPLLIKLIAAQY